MIATIRNTYNTRKTLTRKQNLGKTTVWVFQVTNNIMDISSDKKTVDISSDKQLYEYLKQQTTVWIF